ncbi:MAG: lipid-A-disaccharide synthase [Alphaproteobacteria bacterium]|nr:lipid-A-disaccharide synthase [Alphaproteobacteria bacterium]
MKKLFFIVGENSGDVIAAKLIRALKAKHGDQVQCMGIGGPLMEAEGFEVLLPMDQISVIGIWEVIPRIPDLMKIFKALREEIETSQPDGLITVDFPEFNFMLGKSLKKRGVFKGKHIHYVAPSVWAWRPGRAQNCSKFLDAMVCLFEMEVKHFEQHGLKTIAVGHPLVESRADAGNGMNFRHDNQIPDESKTLGLFFGSRESEFKSMTGILREAATLVNDVQKQQPLHVIAPTLPKTEYDLQNRLLGFDLPIYISSNPTVKWDAFKGCEVAVAVSGTVALELAYAGVPHIITYKVNPITFLILRLLVKVKHIHLANILLGRDVVPEYLQGKCNSLDIATGASDLLKSKKLQEAQKEAFRELRKILGADSDQKPSEKAANFISEIINVR